MAVVALGPAHQSLTWLAALVVPIALLGMLLLRQLLEDRFTHRFVGDDIAAALATTASAEEVEQLVAAAAERLFRPRPR